MKQFIFSFLMGLGLMLLPAKPAQPPASFDATASLVPSEAAVVSYTDTGEATPLADRPAYATARQSEGSARAPPTHVSQLPVCQPGMPCYVPQRQSQPVRQVYSSCGPGGCSTGFQPVRRLFGRRR